MRIYVNDQLFSLNVSCTLQEMLEQTIGIKAYVAVAINNQFIPKIMFSTVMLQEGDRIDLITPMQGG